MACDTVAGWQVVLANGDIVEANANQNADLWQVSIYQTSYLPTQILTL
jgi:FAD/FMN-containing dehydrogenase